MKCNIYNGYVLTKIKKYAAKILDQGNPYISLSKMSYEAYFLSSVACHFRYRYFEPNKWPIDQSFRRFSSLIVRTSIK